MAVRFELPAGAPSPLSLFAQRVPNHPHHEMAFASPSRLVLDFVLWKRLKPLPQQGFQSYSFQQP